MHGTPGLGISVAYENNPGSARGAGRGSRAAVTSEDQDGSIITALETYVRSRRLARLKHFKGAVDLDIDLPTLRGRQ